MAHQPYNPLDKVHLGESVVRALLTRPVVVLPPAESFTGAGIYALYYTGDFPAYRISGQAKAYSQACVSLKKRRWWMHYHAYWRQH